MSLCAIPSMAIAQSGGGSQVGSANQPSVVMRRPLPSPTTGQVPVTQPGGPVTTPSDPSGPVDPTLPTEPGDGSCNPAVSVCPQPDPSPPDVEDPGDDPDGVDFYDWTYVVGPWSGGGQCGKTSTMSRSVECMRTSYRYGNSDGIKCASGKTDQYGNCAGSSFPAPDQQCQDYGQVRPVSSVSTNGANCGYSLSTSYGEWDSTCSTHASRSLEYTCIRGSDGSKVSLDFCRLDMKDGGKERVLPESETRPVYESCNADNVRWFANEEDSYDCNHSPQRPIYLSYTCQSRSQGQWQDDAEDACGAIEKPTKTVRYEACWYGYLYQSYNPDRSACITTGPGVKSYTGGVTAYLVKDSRQWDANGTMTGTYVDASGQKIGTNIYEIVNDTCGTGGSKCCETQTWDYQGFDRKKYDQMVAVWTYDADVVHQAPSGLSSSSIPALIPDYHPTKPF